MEIPRYLESCMGYLEFADEETQLAQEFYAQNGMPSTSSQCLALHRVLRSAIGEVGRVLECQSDEIAQRDL